MSNFNLKLTKVQRDRIMDQAKSCICLVSKNGEEETSQGFFCKIPYPEKDDYLNF